MPECFRGLSLRQLSTMRVSDRLSCYVKGIQLDFAMKDSLSRPEWFGQFGSVQSVQLIQNTSPPEVLLRFSTEAAADAAISWCNEKPALSAKNGYTKFCIKFLNGRQCKRARCHLRHEWCGESAVVVPEERNCEMNSVCAAVSTPNSVESAATVKSTATARRPKANNSQTVLQQQFTQLQRQFSLQEELIERLLTETTSLQAMNQRLRMENHVMYQYGLYHRNGNGNGKHNQSHNSAPSQPQEAYSSSSGSGHGTSPSAMTPNVYGDIMSIRLSSSEYAY